MNIASIEGMNRCFRVLLLYAISLSFLMYSGKSFPQSCVNTNSNSTNLAFEAAQKSNGSQKGIKLKMDVTASKLVLSMFLDGHFKNDLRIDLGSWFSTEQVMRLNTPEDLGFPPRFNPKDLEEQKAYRGYALQAEALVNEHILETQELTKKLLRQIATCTSFADEAGREFATGMTSDNSAWCSGAFSQLLMDTINEIKKHDEEVSLKGLKIVTPERFEIKLGEAVIKHGKDGARVTNKDGTFQKVDDGRDQWILLTPALSPLGIKKVICQSFPSDSDKKKKDVQKTFCVIEYAKSE